MPLIPVNSSGLTIAAATPGAPLADRIAQAMATLAPGAPVIVMIHGFRFSSRHRATCPHNHILSLTPDPAARKAVSWPRHLGFGRGGAHDAAEDEGLCIAFGWEARGTLWQAHAEAARAGTGLALLIGMIRAARPGTAVHVLAHSLGSRVLLSALHALPAGSVGRAILMAAAEFQHVAQAALATPAGRSAEVISITTRENDLFDLAMELLIPLGGRALGQGIGIAAPNWLDIQIDQAETLKALAGLGHRIALPDLRVCHWSAYLRPGLFGLYRALLRQPDALRLADLRAALPEKPEPRWTRLFTLPRLAFALPRAGKASS